MKWRLLMLATFGGCAVGLWLDAHAQTPAKPKLIAGLAFGSPETIRNYLEVLKRALQELGWVEGRNVAYETRWAYGKERLPHLAKELVARAASSGQGSRPPQSLHGKRPQRSPS